MKELLKSGKVVPVIDGCYPLSKAAEALRYFETVHAKGKVVIAVEHNGRRLTAHPEDDTGPVWKPSP